MRKNEIIERIPCHMKKGNGYAVKYKGENCWYFILDKKLEGKYPHFFNVVLSQNKVWDGVKAPSY